MKKESKQNIKIEATTGEVYIDYPLNSGQQRPGYLRRLGMWMDRCLNDHYARLEKLRVYDHRRVDESK